MEGYGHKHWTEKKEPKERQQEWEIGKKNSASQIETTKIPREWTNLILKTHQKKEKTKYTYIS